MTRLNAIHAGLNALVAAALLAMSATAFAQLQSGSGIPASGAIPPTGTSGDNIGSMTTAPRTPQTSVGTSGAYSSVPAGPSTGRCDTLIGEERNRCLREQAAATGGSGASPTTAGPSSSGMGSNAGSGASTGSSGASTTR